MTTKCADCSERTHPQKRGFPQTRGQDPGVIRIRPPSIKVEKLEISQDKMGSKDCKWSSLNAPGTENPLSHPVLKLDEFPFPIIGLWGNKNQPPSMKVKKLKIFWNKMGSMDCKWSSLNAPGTQTPLSHPILKLGEFPFPIISPLG